MTGGQALVFVAILAAGAAQAQSSAQFVSHPELKGSGLASNVNQTYDSTAGAVVEGEYLFTPHVGVKLRYVSEKFKPSNGGQSVDGSHAGLLLSYYF